MDGGAVGQNGIIEKDINLSIGLKLRDILQLYGMDVVMTRETDTSIHNKGITGIKKQKTSDIHNRLKIIEEHPGSITLSIHQNQFSQSKYSGTQIFYGQQDDSSKTVAEILQRRFIEMIQPENTRKCKPINKDVYLIYHAPSTAVLVECGFLSNTVEAQRLTEEEYQDKIAFVIFSSLMEYLGCDLKEV